MLFRLTGRTRDAVLAEIAAALARIAAPVDPQAVLRVLAEREDLSPTAVGEGIALPHGRIPGISGTRGVIALADPGVPFGEPDGIPVRTFVGVVAPPQGSAGLLQALGLVSRRLQDAEVRRALLAASTPAEVHALLVGSAPTWPAPAGP